MTISHFTKRTAVILGALVILVSLPVVAATSVAPKPKVLTPLPVPTDEQLFVTLLDRTLPSVVSIVGSQTDSSGKIQVIGSGTGFVVDANGLILTNRHVVVSSNLTYRVYFPDGRRYIGTVVALDQLEDLAIVKINADKLVALPLGDSDSTKIGQTAVAIGNSLGRYPNTVTRGIVSGIGRSITAGNDLTGEAESLDDVIQTDAEINPGNSGGPLLNSKGEVVGIDSAIEQDGRGVGFAIPINEAKGALDSYKKNGRIIHPYLGVRYSTITPEVQDEMGLAYGYGALVTSGDGQGGPAVVPDAPADKAGLKDHDIILSVNDELLKGRATLFRVVQQHKVGEVLRLQVYRSGQTLPLTVTLQEVPPPTP